MNFDQFFYSILDILNEMSPYIILGFLIAGFLHEFVKPSTMSRHLAGKGWSPVVKAAMFGVPLPLCSCGVLPTAVGLHRQGASKAATTSFLIATPQTGVDSIAATYSLLGLPMAILRPIAALVGGVVGGMSVSWFGKNGATATTVAAVNAPEHDHRECHAEPKRSLIARVGAAVKYGMVDMVASVGKWLVIGLIIAALITVYVPSGFLVSLSDRPILAMLAMIVIAIPMYVCATGSIPIALSLMMKGLNPGATFVLLMAGPAANFASMMVLGKAIGRRATAIYVGSVVVTALFFGCLVDYLFPTTWFHGDASLEQACCHESTLFATICSAILILALIYAWWSTRDHKHTHSSDQSSTDNMKQEIKIEGMSCNHCRMTVEKAIAAVPGVTNVDVSLSDGKATVEGDFNLADVANAVTTAGFDIK